MMLIKAAVPRPQMNQLARFVPRSFHTWRSGHDEIAMRNGSTDGKKAPENVVRAALSTPAVGRPAVTSPVHLDCVGTQRTSLGPGMSGWSPGNES